MSQQDQAQQLLNKTLEQVKVAQERRDMARSESAMLEQRNARTVAEGRDSASKQAKKIVDEAKQLRAVVHADISKLITVKEGLLDEVGNLNKEKEKVSVEAASRTVRREELDAEILDRLQKLDELDQQLVGASEDLQDRRGKLLVLHEDIKEVDQNKQRMVLDLEVLDETVSATQDKVMELDTEFKTRKESLGIQTAEAERKLNDALANLVDAQNKDRQIRENWADEHRKLEKRIQAVRIMEAKLSDAETRIAELDRYMKL